MTRGLFGPARVAIVELSIDHTASVGTRPRSSTTRNRRSSPLVSVTFCGVMRSDVGSSMTASVVVSVIPVVMVLPAVSRASTALVVVPDAMLTMHSNSRFETTAGTPSQRTVGSDSASNTEPLTVTGPDGTTAPRTGELIDRCGAVLSIRTVTVVSADAPLVLLADPATVCSPSCVSVTGGSHEIVPAPAQTKPTVTSVLFHPAAFGDGAAPPAIATPPVVACVTGTLIPAIVTVPVRSVPVAFEATV